MVKRLILLFSLVFLTLVTMPAILAGAVINDAFNITTSCKEFTCSAVKATIFFPNSSIFINNSPMTSTGIYAFYQFTPPVFGTYNYIFYDGGNYSIGNFTATGTGEDLTTPQSFLYIGFFGILIFLFFANLFLITKFPKGNQKDESGVVTVTNMKYLTMMLVYIEWLFIFAMLFISYNLAQAYFAEQLFSNYLFMLFRVAFGLTIILTLIWFFWIIMNIFNDKQIKNMLRKGLPGTGKPGMNKY